MKNPLVSIGSAAKKHKIISILTLAVLIGGGYYEYHSYSSGATTTQYVIQRISTGNIIQSVTGTGQVSSENQLDLSSKVSGSITSIPATVGQHVDAGDLIATIDPTDAARSLQSAKISLAKLTQAAKSGDMTNAQNNVQKSYSDSFSAVTDSFSDLQTVIPGLKDLLTSQNGFLSGQHSTYLTPAAQTYRSNANDQYEALNNEYVVVLTEYKSLSRTSATSSIAKLLGDTHTLVSDAAGTVKSVQNTVAYITNTQPEYQTKDLATAQGNINSWNSLITSDVSSILSAQNSIASNENTLSQLIIGADALDVRSSELSLQQAQETYDNYFIRAPFAGTIGRIPVSVYSQASGGTIIATVIGDAKVATISLNEVDAAKVKAGQPVSITFDAIDSLVATGTVQSIDLVGTVSQGVVSYNAKIAINTADPRILPGMSLNVTITTFEKDGVLIAPTTAIKTANRQSTVQVVDPAVVTAYMQSLRAQSGATSTPSGGFNGGSASSSRGSYVRQGTSTAAFSGAASAGSARPNRQTSFTITSPTLPVATSVTIGSADSTNSEIASGLQGGEWVVVRTVTTTGTAATTAAPSLLSSLGAGGRGPGGGTGGAVRTGGAPTAPRGN